MGKAYRMTIWRDKYCVYVCITLVGYFSLKEQKFVTPLYVSKAIGG